MLKYSNFTVSIHPPTKVRSILKTRFIKSQVTADFIIVLSIALIIFLGVLAVSDKRNSMLDSYRKRIYAKELADKVALEINSVFLAGHGTKKTLILPETLKDNTPYNITIYPTSHLVNIDYGGAKRHYTTTIITGNINAISVNATIKLTNINGGILVEK